MTSDEAASPKVDEPKPAKPPRRTAEVVDGADADLVRMTNGATLPITYASWKGARQHEWYKPLDRAFNMVFYAALKAAGVEMYGVGNHDMAVLARYRRALALSKEQLRGAYGLEKGVFGHNGRFLDADWDQQLLKARKKTPDKQRHPGPFGDDPDVWNQIEADAVEASKHKRDQVNIDTEFRWIRSHLGEWPDFSKAPSRGAVKDWLEINRPGNDTLKRDFLKLAWQRRLTPGDRGATKPAAFEEDVVDDTALTKYEGDLEERLAQAEGGLDKESASDDAAEST